MPCPPMPYHTIPYHAMPYHSHVMPGRGSPPASPSPRCWERPSVFAFCRDASSGGLLCDTWKWSPNPRRDSNLTRTWPAIPDAPGASTPKSKELIQIQIWREHGMPSQMPQAQVNLQAKNWSTFKSEAYMACHPKWPRRKYTCKQKDSNLTQTWLTIQDASAIRIPESKELNSDNQGEKFSSLIP